MSNSAQRYRHEIDRIRQEYVRRAKAIPKNFYGTQTGDIFIYERRRSKVFETLKRENILPLFDKEILDVGCGLGAWLADFQNWGAAASHLHGIDLGETKIETARVRMPQADLAVGEGSRLKWPDGMFDLVIQSTLFTSVLDDRLKKAIAQEILRVLKPGGVILWYDFRYDNPQNPRVKGIEAGEIRSLFPHCRIKLSKITLAPPLARFFAPWALPVCCLLEKIPFLNTHYLAVIRP